MGRWIYAVEEAEEGTTSINERNARRKIRQSKDLIGPDSITNRI